MSSLSEIRSKVSEQRRINNELHAELNEIAYGVNNTRNKWNNLCNDISNTMHQGSQRVNSGHQNIIDAYEIQGLIDKQYVLFKNMELANKKIRSCNNQKIYDFENFRSVRKIVNGMLDNLEVCMVSDAAITKAVEVKHLQLPDYWLTCAMLSIMAWRNDDKDMAERALARACQLDKKNSAVFFLVFNMRVGRESAAIKWFEYYQTCGLTGDDERTFFMLFSIVNNAITQNCSDKFKDDINAFIRRVLEADIKKSGYSEEQMVDRICGYLRRYISNDKHSYPILRKHCGENQRLDVLLSQAKANLGILDFILKTINVTSRERSDYLTDFIMEIIKKPNDVEIGVEDEIKYNEMIIALGGDVEQAKSDFDEMKHRRENDFDIVLEMIDWVFKSGNDDVNPSVKANMFTLIKDIASKSITKYVQGYRSLANHTMSIKINDYETQADFRNLEGEKSKLRQFFENKKAMLLNAVKIWPAFVGFGIGALSFVGAIALAAYPLFIFAVAGITFGGLNILLSGKKKKNIAIDCDNACEAATSILNQIFNDYGRYFAEYKSYDDYYSRINEELEKI